MKVKGQHINDQGLTIEELTVGQSYEKSFVITAELIERFADVTGDHNPIHLNEDYAGKSIFKQRVAQGMLQAGLLSGILGCHFPGVGTIYLSQTLKFIRPVFINDQLTLRLEILEIISDKGRVRLETLFTNQKGEAVITGEAIVKPPSK
jgi:3-hydroxybutyryl-CoA dehydratase